MAPSGITLIIQLVDAQRSRKAGSKATHLSKLIAARFAVPKGFVISADAYRSHLWASGARGAASPSAEAEDREQIRGAILSAEIPDDIWRAIVQAYERLSLQLGVPDPRVAVRPSSLEEDPSGASFEGAYESYLNVSGLEALNAAVKRVWASVWGGKAAAHRTRLENPPEPAMAVIVQQMLDADCTGTASTVDALTGDPSRVLVRCSDSACEEIVQYVVDLRDLSVRKPHEPARDPLPVETVQFVAERAVLVEDIVPGRVEVDWAFNRDGLWILQARPIRGVPSHFPVPRDAELGSEDKWRRITSHPISRFARSHLWGPSRRADSVLISGYVYSRETEATDGASTAKLLRREITQGPQLLAEWENRVGPDLKLRNAQAIERPVAGLEHSALLAALADTAETASRAAEWVDKVQRPSVRFAHLLHELLLDKTDDPSLCQRLLGGLPDPIIMRDAELQELSERFSIAERTGKLGNEKWWRNYKRDVDMLARKCGYAFRNTGEQCDIASWKSWIEDDAPVFRVIGMIAAQDKRPTLITLHCAAEEGAKAAAEEAEKLFHGQKRSTFTELLRLARGWLPKRNEADFAYALACTALRLVLVELARRLCKAGAINEEEDVFQLTLDELLALPAELTETDRAAIATKVAARKHELWLERRLNPPCALRAGGGIDEPTANTDQPNGLFMGRGASPGTVVGRARSAAGIADAGEMESGDILIVSLSKPAWTPFLSLAGGLISEHGSELCSEAILARYYGVPAVVGCEGILDAIRDGLRVTVNGSEGVVELGDGSANRK